jgi:hypothetical protein
MLSEFNSLNFVLNSDSIYEKLIYMKGFNNANLGLSTIEELSMDMVI